MFAWIIFALIATVLNTFRAGLQKSLISKFPKVVVSWIRAPLSLPIFFIILILLYFLLPELPQFHYLFFVYCFLAGVLRTASSRLFVEAMSQRNFALSLTLVRTDVVQAVVIGIIFFDFHLTLIGWLSVILSFSGAILCSISKLEGSINKIIKNNNNWGLLAGLGVGFTEATNGFLFKEASLYVSDGSPIFTGVLIATIITLVLTIILFPSVCKSLHGNLLFQPRKLKFKVAAIGALHVVGNIAMITAILLDEVVHVKIVSQITVVYGIIASHYVFKEEITFIEYCGIFLTVSGILLLLFSA